MKDKFSIFSPPISKKDNPEPNINFQKSPNKFAVYEPLTKPRQGNKISANQSLSATNIENMRKLPNEYSALRQTLNFKPSNFEAWMQKDEKQKAPKPSNILRQTMDSRSLFRPKLQKYFSESENMERSAHNQSYDQRPTTQTNLTYTRRTNFEVEPKSMQHLQMAPLQNNDPGIKQLREKWKSGAFKVDKKKQKVNEDVQFWKKLGSSRIKGQEQTKQRTYLDRKHSQTIQQSTEHEQGRTFRKKLSPAQVSECHTPTMPKYTYEDRFKKLTSPTSTNNSDSRSPPTKFRDLQQNWQKPPQKMSIEDFQILKTLGEGKFGLVLMVRHKKTKSLYALKKIPKQMIKSHYMIDQLALEIRLQTYLNHKNILGIYGFFDNSSHLFIILEYMEQGTLYSQLKQNKILAEDKAAEIIKQMTEAIEFIHDHDIAHRDIKPQNIVISNNVFKLCDFGWATICNERRKTYCGTFDYAAPEILEGKDYDWSVDLWCLGILTFQLLTGKAPFYHLSRKQTMKKIINCEMENVTFPETMSAEAIDFIERLIVKNPDMRMKATEALKHKFLTQIEEQ